MNSTALSSRPISVSDDIFIVLQGSQNDNVIERPMFMPDVTFLGFLPDFCLYCYKIKLYSHHFLPLMAVVCPSETPSVLSGINRILTISRGQEKSTVNQAFERGSIDCCAFKLRRTCFMRPSPNPQRPPQWSGRRRRLRYSPS